jgi:oligopeptide/dipeptide ABC transporter ATP-binding protein
LSVQRGEIVGLVGESGCGKSMTALAVSGLLPEGIHISRGFIRFGGKDLAELSGRERRALNGSRIGIVFQDAMAALNPTMRVGRQIAEVLKIHTDVSAAERRERTLKTMADVGLEQPERLMRRFPHELSGGQRQRVLIAMAVITRPPLLIADEPTTALDVGVQDQILKMLAKICRRENMAILYISHDLSTVRRLCDRVCVLYAGMPAETGPTAELLQDPKHEYTRMLLQAIPTPDKKGQRLSAIPGRLPDNRGPAEHCLFADRCPQAFDRCRQEVPPTRTVHPQHTAACFLNERKEVSS